MDAEVDDLYGLPLDEFIKARDTLAKAMAKERGKQAGGAVKALRKPSVVAWALNQLARRHPEDVQALLDAGARLRRAQTAALDGGDPAELRDATRAENREVQALAGQAASILRDAGRGGSTTQEERLAASLRASAVDSDAGDLLRRGVLTEELSPAGFGFGIGEGLQDDFRASTADSRPSTHESQKREEERAERERQRELEAELRTAREQAHRLTREATRAEEQAQEARAAADAANARVEELETSSKMSKGRKG